VTRDALNFSYENHAAWVLEDSMAGSLATVDQMLSSVWQAAVKRVGEEVKEMEEVIAAEGGEAGVEPWDYRFGGQGCGCRVRMTRLSPRFWNEKVRKQKYAIDNGMLKPYLQLHRLRDGMFWVAQQL